MKVKKTKQNEEKVVHNKPMHDFDEVIASAVPSRSLYSYEPAKGKTHTPVVIHRGRTVSHVPLCMTIRDAMRVAESMASQFVRDLNSGKRTLANAS